MDNGYVNATLMPGRRQWVGVDGGVGPNWSPLTLSESYVLPGGYAPHPDQSGMRVASNSTWIDEYCRSPLENGIAYVDPPNKIKLSVYDGSHLSWLTWINQFHDMIHSRKIRPGQKLGFLYEHLCSFAQEIIGMK